MKNIVSFSLWGDHPMFWVGAKENIKLIRQFYPEFTPRFYIDNSCRVDLIDTIKQEDNIEIYLMDRIDDYHGMFWRFYGSADPDVDIFLSRDCDSRITEREVAAVREWLKSDKKIHIMRDHPYHTVPILGGMWGCRGNIMKDLNIIEKINNWNQFYRKGLDQDFLEKNIYPYITEQVLEHSEFNISFKNEIKPFPHIRQNYEFVGDVFDENNNRHPDFYKMIY